MRLDTLTLEQCELTRQWRNAPDVLPMLRTKEPVTIEQQAAFYRDVVCNPDSNHRYYALFDDVVEETDTAIRFAHPFIGMGGLTYLDRVPGEGEISLILGPDFRRTGLGSQAVLALRDEAGRLGLRWVVGECYDSNPALDFWVKQVARCDGHARFPPGRMQFRMRATPQLWVRTRDEEGKWRRHS